MVQHIGNEVEIVEKFRIDDDHWVILCFHNPSYGVWNLSRDGIRTMGVFAGSLEGAIQIYQDRVCSLLESESGCHVPELSGA